MRLIAFCTRNSNPTPPILPLVHTTRAVPSRSIFETSIIEDSRNREIVYFFYGLPSYKPEPEVNASTADSHLYPICFVVKPVSDDILRAIYPFDTGAFEAEYYKEIIGSEMLLKDFYLGDTLTIAPKVVATFFETNYNYYTGKRKPSIHFDFEDIEAHYYFDLIQINGRTHIDSRRRTIEIHAQHKLAVGEHLHILAIVVPDISGQSELIERFTEKWDAALITYPEWTANTPEECIPLIKEKVFSFYQRIGLL